MKITAQRYHDISCGHRVVGHESKCALLHGHNYRVHFVCRAEQLDVIGRVIDFSVIKQRLCQWLEDHWDHRFLAWKSDGLLRGIYDTAQKGGLDTDSLLTASVVWVPFNPTAEQMAEHLLNVIGPLQLEGTGVKLISVKIDETRKCSAKAEL